MGTLGLEELRDRKGGRGLAAGKGTSRKRTEEAYGTEGVARFKSMVMSFVSDRRKERRQWKKSIMLIK